MKTLGSLFTLLFLTCMLSAETPAPAPAAKLTSHVYAWDELKVQLTKNGARRDDFDGPTTTLDKAHCHITTLNPGEKSSEPRKHLQEEFIVVKEGLVEASIDGKT